MVDVVPLKPVKTPVSLAAIREEPKLKDMALVRYARLSVQPVQPAEWKIVCKMAGIEA
jgi:predicted RNA-binding protein with PUA-like domain